MFKLLKGKEEGFTIAELLIVLVVLGILAAIAIPSYTGLQKRARQAELESNGRAIALGLEMYKAVEGEYPAPDTSSEGGDPLSLKGSLKDYISNYNQIVSHFDDSSVYNASDDRGSYSLVLIHESDPEVRVTFANGAIQSSSISGGLNP